MIAVNQIKYFQIYLDFITLYVDFIIDIEKYIKIMGTKLRYYVNQKKMRLYYKNKDITNVSVLDGLAFERCL